MAATRPSDEIVDLRSNSPHLLIGAPRKVGIISRSSCVTTESRYYVLRANEANEADLLRRGPPPLVLLLLPVTAR